MEHFEEEWSERNTHSKASFLLIFFVFFDFPLFSPLFPPFPLHINATLCSPPLFPVFIQRPAAGTICCLHRTPSPGHYFLHTNDIQVCLGLIIGFKVVECLGHSMYSMYRNFCNFSLIFVVFL